MKLPKVFINEEGYVTIVFGQSYEPEECGVTIVHDSGLRVSKEQDIPRYSYHCGSAYGDSGFFSFTNDKLYKGVQKYKLVKEKSKKK